MLVFCQFRNLCWFNIIYARIVPQQQNTSYNLKNFIFQIIILYKNEEKWIDFLQVGSILFANHCVHGCTKPLLRCSDVTHRFTYPQNFQLGSSYFYMDDLFFKQACNPSSSMYSFLLINFNIFYFLNLLKLVFLWKKWRVFHIL